jgi:hypothetical protein
MSKVKTRKPARVRSVKPSPALPFSDAFVRDFSRGSAALQALTFRVIALSLANELGTRLDPASYCATSQQRAELKQLTLNAEERDRIATRRAVKEDRLRARHERERARLYEKHSRESERL